MSASSPEQPPLALCSHHTPEQLHGKACIICNSGMDGLTPVGHVYTDGTEPRSQLGWSAVACPQHVERGQRLCLELQAQQIGADLLAALGDTKYAAVRAAVHKLMEDA